MRNIVLSCNLPELTLGIIPIKINGIKPFSIKDNFTIIMRDSEGKTVKKKRTYQGEQIGKTNYNYINSDNKMVSEQELKYFVIDKDGVEQEKDKFDKSDIIEIEKIVDKGVNDIFFCEKKEKIDKATDKNKPQIEIQSLKGLARLNEYLTQNHKVAVVRNVVLSKSWKMYPIGFITNIDRKDDFKLTLDLCSKKAEDSEFLPKITADISVPKKKLEMIAIEV